MKKKRNKILILFTILTLLTGNLQAVFALEQTETPNISPVKESVLYDDGTLIINEEAVQREENRSKHGNLLAVYPAAEGMNPYLFHKQDDPLWTAEKEKIKAVEFGSPVQPVSTAYWFSGLVNLERMDLTGLDVTKTKNMTSMFENAGSDNGCEVKGKLLLPHNVKAGSLFKQAKVFCTVKIEGVPAEDREMFSDANPVDSVNNEFYGEITLVSKDTATSAWAADMKKKYAESNILLILPEKPEDKQVTSLSAGKLQRGSKLPASDYTGQGTWKEDSAGYWYQLKSGRHLKNEYAIIDGYIYWFNSSGYMYKGWHKYQNSYFLFKGISEDGYKEEPWGNTPEGGLVLNSWIKTSDGRWFFLGADGEMYVGKHTIGGNHYYFMASTTHQKFQYGEMTYNLWTDYGNGLWRFQNAEGEDVKNNWHIIESKRYWFDTEGYMDPKWTQIEHSPGSYISSGKISSWNTAVCNGGTQSNGGTYVCKIKGTDGTSLNGCCLNPGNDKLASVNTKVKLKRYNNANLMARIAYLGTKQYSTQDAQYIVSRCAALGGGNVSKNHYERVTEVNDLYDRAVASGPAPDGFEAYYGAPANGEQQLLVWRYNPKSWVDTPKTNGTISLKKSNAAADPDSSLSLAGAEYWIYKDSNLSSWISTPLKTDAKGNSNTVTVSPGIYWIQEWKAPAGFMLDKTVYKIAVDSEGKVNLQVSDMPVNGKLQLKKSVAQDEHLTSLCPEQYILEGAEYTVFKERAGKTVVGKLITKAQKKDAAGKLYAETNPLSIPGGSYYVKETKAPKGYKMDKRVYSVQIKNGETTLLPVKEVPQFDPLTLTLQKHIPEGKPWTKQYLKDAEYTVRYYTKYLNTPEEVAKETPLRTWVFRTDDDGTFQIDDNPKMNWYVGGNPLFKQEDGTVVGLYGTLTYEETKAPPGFIKNDGITIRQIHQGIDPEDINDTNHGDVNNVAAEEVNNEVQRQIVVTKKISEENVYTPYGYPTAIFECKGEDVYGKPHTYTKSVTLDESTLKNGYYTGTVVFDHLPAGLYDVSEVKISRYIFKALSDLSDNAKAEGEIVHVELVNSLNGKATYENVISRWNDYSDRECVVNRF